MAYILFNLKKQILNFKFLSTIILFSVIIHGITKINIDLFDTSDLIYSFMAVAGLFISFLLFGDIITKDLEYQTIRYYIPAISRTNYMFSKFMSIIITWIAINIIINIYIYTQTDFFNFKNFITVIIADIFFSSITLLASVMIRKKSTIFFYGIIFSIAYTFLGYYFIDHKIKLLHFLSYIFPYTYLDNFYLSFLLLIYSLIIFFIINNVVFKNKEL